MVCGLRGHFGQDVQQSVALASDLGSGFVTTRPHNLGAFPVWEFLQKLRNVALECLVLWMVYGHFGRHGRIVQRLVL